MKSRYLLGAGAALAVAFGCAEANAQFAFMGGPYPTLFYVGPEGGWTSLSNQKDTIHTTPVRVDSGLGLAGANGPFFSNFNGSARYNSGFHARCPRGLSGERVPHSIMTNVIYDFTIGWPVTPHIGFGVGAVDNVDSISLNPVTLNGLGLTTVSGPGGVLGRIGAGTPFPNPTLGGTFLKGSQWNFGYQAIVGVRDR